MLSPWTSPGNSITEYIDPWCGSTRSIRIAHALGSISRVEAPRNRGLVPSGSKSWEIPSVPQDCDGSCRKASLAITENGKGLDTLQPT